MDLSSEKLGAPSRVEMRYLLCPWGVRTHKNEHSTSI